MNQLTFIKSRIRKAHGGDLSIGKRRSRRPLNIKKPMHVTLRSEFAHSGRCLLKHRKIIESVVKKAARRFRISVYEKAICGNHIHLLVRGKTRMEIQNFFRVVAGHTAQQILLLHPLRPNEKPRVRGGARGNVKRNTCKHLKNQRKFWATLIYSRLLSGWGKEFRIVRKYIEQNTLEALGIIPYQPRKSRYDTMTVQMRAVPPSAFV